jgi:flagellar basal-body rod modification protein FlgD
MSTSAVTNTSSTNGSTTSGARQALGSDLQNFLKLLTTQLQNQDPTAPIDTNQMTQQIAMLSQVEQQINTNENLEQLISMYTSAQVGTAVSYIGKQVDAEGNQSVLKNKQANFVYNLASKASTVTVSVLDSTGAVIYSANANQMEQGRNEIGWDGRTTAGSTAPDGVYSFKVTAKDATGKEIKATTYTTGLVSSVDTQDGLTSLSLGQGLFVPLEKVKSIRG